MTQLLAVLAHALYLASMFVLIVVFNGAAIYLLFSYLPQILGWLITGGIGGIFGG